MVEEVALGTSSHAQTLLHSLKHPQGHSDRLDRTNLRAAVPLPTCYLWIQLLGCMEECFSSSSKEKKAMWAPSSLKMSSQDRNWHLARSCGGGERQDLLTARAHVKDWVCVSQAFSWDTVRPVLERITLIHTRAKYTNLKRTAEPEQRLSGQMAL